MNLGDSMRLQNNINKVEKIKEDGEEYNLLPMEWQIFPFAYKNNKLPEKTEVCKFQ